jgi:hypothetical protein
MPSHAAISFIICLAVSLVMMARFIFEESCFLARARPGRSGHM